MAGASGLVAAEQQIALAHIAVGKQIDWQHATMDSCGGIALEGCRLKSSAETGLPKRRQSRSLAANLCATALYSTLTPFIAGAPLLQTWTATTLGLTLEPKSREDCGFWCDQNVAPASAEVSLASGLCVAVKHVHGQVAARRLT